MTVLGSEPHASWQAGNDVDVTIRDVTLRDGLQSHLPIPTAEKLSLFTALVASGIRELELTSFAKPDRVPATADAEALAASTSGTAVVRWGLVLNVRGAQRAISAGLSNLQFVVSVSETHNLENSGRSVAGSLAELEAIVHLTQELGGVTEVTVATAFGCPFDGPVSAETVRATAAASVAAGVAGVNLADTIGTAVPTDVNRLVDLIGRDHPEIPIGIHLHDTRGLAIANALAAVQAGAIRIDGTVGGLGGCPFAPGASGNLALEDLVHALTHMGIRTGVDVGALIRAAELACRLVGSPVSSHVGIAGERFDRLAVPQMVR